jgi:4-diphosphocytidyl-2-C-methyl-D-erythritol kinase
MITETAFAKINLCLHVTGQRPDGYHLLDSLVAFADAGDVITCTAADGLALTITGPQAANLPVTDDNLVLRAARAMGRMGAAITLEKHLPVASGIGGGSADAAATLRALLRLWNLPLPDPATVLALGADVPVCLSGQTLRMQGVGEVLTPLPPLPETHILLVNPRVGVATPAVFRALACKTNPPLPEPPRFADAAALAAWLTDQRNDLEPPAITLTPVIATVKTAIAAQSGCLLARMSGSGATCFGLFATAAKTRAAANSLNAAHPDWWITPSRLIS